MVEITEKMRRLLKKPLGRLYGNIGSAKKELAGKRIIAVGDITIIRLLAKKIMPHMAVFDYQTRRRKLAGKYVRTIKKCFPKAKKYLNAPGSLGNRLVRNAKKLMKKGGGIFIKGEEDLTALAFMIKGTGKDRIIYGQPGKGVVIVNPDRIRKKMGKLLGLSSASLGHKVKRYE